MTNLDDLSVYARFDPSGMWQRIASLPDQMKQAWEDALALELPSHYANVDKVVLAGIGGSGVGGDLLEDLLSLEAAGPVFAVSRDYHLPPWVDRNTLVIACSYSGNTAETLACFRDATERLANVVVITSGGRLSNEADALNLPVLRIHHQVEPRAALGFSFIAPLALLQGLDLISDKITDMKESLAMLRDSSFRYLPEQPAKENRGKTLAQALVGRLVVVYGAGFLKGVARRWKTQVNENAKNWAFVETLPELNHNSVAGYRFPQAITMETFVVLLHSSLLHPQVIPRYPVTSKILKQAGVSHECFQAEGTSHLSQMLTTIYAGDWASYYLALLNGVDPSPVPTIDELKRQLGGA